MVSATSRFRVAGSNTVATNVIVRIFSEVAVEELSSGTRTDATGEVRFFFVI